MDKLHVALSRNQVVGSIEAAGAGLGDTSWYDADLQDDLISRWRVSDYTFWAGMLWLGAMLLTTFLCCMLSSQPRLWFTNSLG